MSVVGNESPGARRALQRFLTPGSGLLVGPFAESALDEESEEDEDEDEEAARLDAEEREEETAGARRLDDAEERFWVVDF